MLTLQRCAVSQSLAVLGSRHCRRLAHPLEQTSSKRASDISTISKSCLMVEAYARGASALHGSISMTVQRQTIGWLRVWSRIGTAAASLLSLSAAVTSWGRIRGNGSFLLESGCELNLCQLEFIARL